MSGSSSTNLLVSGFVIVIIVCLVTFTVPFGVLAIAKKISPYLSFALETIMCYQIFCTKSLKDESMKVFYGAHHEQLILDIIVDRLRAFYQFVE